MPAAEPGTMYLVLPVPFRRSDGKLFVEAQAANGLNRWADNFTQLTVAAPVIPEHDAANLAGFVWRDAATLEHRDRIALQPLPWAYTPGPFFKQFTATRKLIGATIAQHQHLQFAIGGLIGDWAAIAAIEAIKQRRRYAIHTDRVEHELIRRTAPGSSPLRRAKVAVEAPIMQRYHRHIIRHCSLGLWHGDDCFRAYAPWGRENHLIHDIHTKPTDLIDDDGLAAKLADIRNSPTLNLCYAGRLDPMKAPLDWLRAIAIAREQGGANITATWYGEGSLFAAAKAEASRLNLNDIVAFPGFVAGRAELLQKLRAAHALVFTHITPESPRILIEALVCGTPILGYDTGYATNLLSEHGGGETVLVGDGSDLAHVIVQLFNDRERLAQLAIAAANNGRRFTDAAVFAERSHLIQTFA